MVIRAFKGAGADAVGGRNHGEVVVAKEGRDGNPEVGDGADMWSPSGSDRERGECAVELEDELAASALVGRC